MLKKLITRENPNYFSIMNCHPLPPCGEVTTVMRTLICPEEVFTFHHCELFEAVIHCIQWSVVTQCQLSLWLQELQLHKYSNNCPSEKRYKAKLSSRMYVSLVRMALKRR